MKSSIQVEPHSKDTATTKTKGSVRMKQLLGNKKEKSCKGLCVVCGGENLAPRQKIHKSCNKKLRRGQCGGNSARKRAAQWKKQRQRVSSSFPPIQVTASSLHFGIVIVVVFVNVVVVINDVVRYKNCSLRCHVNCVLFVRNNVLMPPGYGCADNHPTKTCPVCGCIVLSKLSENSFS